MLLCDINRNVDWRFSSVFYKCVNDANLILQRYDIFYKCQKYSLSRFNVSLQLSHPMMR